MKVEGRRAKTFGSGWAIRAPPLQLRKQTCTVHGSIVLTESEKIFVLEKNTKFTHSNA
jgi:hypothetical protein